MKSSFNSKSARLMTIPAGYTFSETTFSADGYRVGIILQKNNKSYMSINGTLSSAYDEVRDLVFANNYQYSVFIARKGTQECIVYNGKESALYDGITKPVFTSKGTLVYAARHKDQWVIISGTKESPSFVSNDPLLFASPDGTRLAYIAQNSTTKKKQLRVCNSDLSNLVMGNEYDDITAVRNDFSRSHLVLRVVKGDKQAVVLFDFRQPGFSEQVFAWYDEINKFTLSANGEHIAYLARRGTANYLVKDTVEIPCPALDMTLDVNVLQNGKTLHTGVIKNAVSVFLDGAETGNKHETVEDLTVSSDGLHYLYVAGHKSRYFTVIDSNKSLLYDKIVLPRFSPDSSRAVYRARTGGQRFIVVADTKTGQVIQEQAHYEAIWDFTFSPDGKSIGYGVKDGPELWWKVEKLATTDMMKAPNEKK